MKKTDTKSRLLSVVAALLLLFTVLSSVVFSAGPIVRADDSGSPFKGTGTRADPYLIQSSADWLTLAKLVNGGQGFSNQFFEMTKNIDLSDLGNWTPIGLADSGNYFRGVINGCGYYVCGVNCVQSNEAALFGTLAGYIYNLGVETGNFEGKKAAALAVNSTSAAPVIFNCYNRATINGTECAGGLVCDFKADVIDCWNAGPVNGNKKGGVAYNAAYVIRCYSTDIAVVSGDFTGENDASYQVANDDNTIVLLFNKFFKHSATGHNLDEKMKKSELFLGEGTDINPFLINSVEDLQVFRGLVNSGYNFSGCYFRQTANLDLSGIEDWDAIGNVKADTYFKGVYDGDGHYVSNIHIEHGGAAGFFGLLAGTVVNLGVRDSYIQGDCVGAIASHGKDKAVNIINCYSINNTIMGNTRAAGIADNFVGDIISCYSANNTIEAPRVAGINSYNCATLWNCVSEDYPLYNEAHFNGVETECIVINDDVAMSPDKIAKHLNNLRNRVIVREGLENVSLNKWVVDNGICVLGAKVSYKTYFLICYFVIIIAIAALIGGVVIYLKKKQKTLNFDNTSIPTVTAILLGSYFLKFLGLLIGNKNFMKMTYFHDINDAFMDFFNPAIVIRNRITSLSDIYIVNAKSTYPPIAQLILGGMSMFVAPAQTSSASIARSSIFGVVMMSVFWFLMVYILYYFMKSVGEPVKTPKSLKNIFYISLIASAPMVYMLERGNIIIIALIGIFIFLTYYQSKDITKRLLAYFALAIAVAIKIYPIFLLVLAFRKRNLRAGIVATAMVGVVNIIPFAFTGGFKGMFAYVNNLINANSYNFQNVTTGISNRGFFNYFCNALGVSTPNKLVIAYTIVVFIVMIIVALFAKSDWIAALATMMLIILIPAQTGVYCISYLIPVVFFGVLDDYKNQLENTLLIICTLPLISFSFIAAIFEVEADLIYACVAVVFQFVVWVLVALLILENLERMKKVRKPRVRFVES